MHFNSKVHDAKCITLHSPSSHTFWVSRSRPLAHQWSSEELRLATGSDRVTGLQHNLKLCSAYPGIPVRCSSVIINACLFLETSQLICPGKLLLLSLTKMEPWHLLSCTDNCGWILVSTKLWSHILCLYLIGNKDCSRQGTKMEILLLPFLLGQFLLASFCLTIFLL